MKADNSGKVSSGRKQGGKHAEPALQGRRVPPAEDREWLRAALHDGLGQILTSISFLASSLSQKLAGRRLPEATEAQELLSLAGRAISETKALVRERDSASGDGAAGGAVC